MNTRRCVRYLPLLLTSALLTLPGAANAAGLYWTSNKDNGTIQAGSPDGSGSVSDLFNR